ncbi:complex I intermediate-associated protein 30, mitochondrial isoform X1 [Macrobrachium rosenbergii]|uniref:complex I intermediate-associated protein 30, mitochondrial isoform X1 n=1 Tax=Macrobrachium rosenbergii TaxID=79674 RepID=UPI0034D75243
MICGIPRLLLPSNLCTTSLGTGPCRTIYSFATRDSFKSSRSLKARYLQPSRIQVSRALDNVQNNAQSVRFISTTPVHWMFWERDRKGGYGGKEKHSKKEMIRAGLKELRGELAKWQEEVKEKFECDPLLIRPGDMDKMWVLKENKDLEEWVVTCDKDHNEGFSSGAVTLSPTGHGLFSGELSTQVPKDGVVKKAGYVNMRSLRPRKSFKRETYLDWSEYNTLELRVRGDGRSYLINISTAGYFDITWNDIYSYALYTRGGPHWQLTRIPFSKFFLSSKGRIQDKQCAIPLDRVVSLGISAGDKINAPFRLEIDYIGVYCDPDHTEEFAYEMYKLPKFYIY